jgi:hypothetical protein
LLFTAFLQALWHSPLTDAAVFVQVSRLVEAVVKQLASPLAEGLLLLVHVLPVPIDELCKKNRS